MITIQHLRALVSTFFVATKKIMSKVQAAAKLQPAQVTTVWLYNHHDQTTFLYHLLGHLKGSPNSNGRKLIYLAFQWLERHKESFSEERLWKINAWLNAVIKEGRPIYEQTDL